MSSSPLVLIARRNESNWSSCILRFPGSENVVGLCCCRTLHGTSQIWWWHLQVAQAMWFLARIEFCCVSVPGKACLGRVIVVNSKKSAIDFCHFPERHGITKSRSTSINIYQPIYNSLAIGILCHCPSLSIIVSFMPLYSYVKPRESRQPRWIHLSLPTTSLAAPATEYQRRLDWHEKVSRLGSWYWERSSGLAWMWLAQESCGNGIKQSQN